MSDPQNDPNATPPQPTADPQTPPADQTDGEGEQPSGVKTTDASVDPNLGHAIEDQKHGVGIGPGVTSEQIEAETPTDDVAGSI